MPKQKNPYSTENGEIMPGKHVEFFAFAKQQYESELAALPPAERAKRIQRQRQFQERMNSEAKVPLIL